MPLSSEQQTALCKALRSALIASFPDDDRLEMMIEDEVTPPLSIPIADDYAVRVFKLVKNAAAGGQLRDVVIGASRAKPGNPELKQFVKDNLQSLIELESIALPSSDLLTSLIKTLRLVSDSDFEGIVLSACLQTLPDIEIFLINLREQLGNPDFSPDFKWLILLKFFLNTYEGLNAAGQLYIVTFVQNLQRLTTGAAQSKLASWMAQLPAELQPAVPQTEPIVHLPRPSDSALKNLQTHFLITVEPPEITSQTEQFRVNGYLMTRLEDDDQFTQFHILTLQVPDSTHKSGMSADDSSKEKLISDIKVRQETKGLFCTLQQIEDWLPDWLIQTQSEIDHLCTELQAKYQLGFRPIYNLTVEFWLPFEHLTAATDTWKIYGKPIRLKQRNLLVGKEYRVVVRSYDRFDDPDSLNELNRTWQTLESLSKNNSDITVGFQNHHHLDCWSLWQDLQQQIQQACLGLSLTCPVCSQSHERQREELFAWILEKGIPIALWSRYSELADDQKADLSKQCKRC